MEDCEAALKDAVYHGRAMIRGAWGSACAMVSGAWYRGRVVVRDAWHRAWAMARDIWRRERARARVRRAWPLQWRFRRKLQWYCRFLRFPHCDGLSPGKPGLRRHGATRGGAARASRVDLIQTAGLLQELANRNGQPLNASETGRRLGISAAAVRYRIALLEKAGMIRVLHSIAHRRPHVLLRDGRLLLELGGDPVAVLRTCLTQCIIVSLAAIAPPIRCFQWEAGRVKRIDLVVSTSRETLGFRLTGDLFLHNRDVASLRLGIERGVIDRGYLIYCGSHACMTARVVIVLPVQDFVEHMDRWLACGSFREARDVFRAVGAGAPHPLAQSPGPSIIAVPGERHESSLHRPVHDVRGLHQPRQGPRGDARRRR
jgi:hypothetical protein